MYSVSQLFICGMTLSKNLMHKSYSDQFGNSQRSLLSPTGGVKRIPPDTAIHEQMATQNYLTTTTSSRPMWTMTTVTRRTSTSTTCARSEHACTLVDVLSFHSRVTPTLAQGRSRVCHTISIPSMMSVSL